MKNVRRGYYRHCRAAIYVMIAALVFSRVAAGEVNVRETAAGAAVTIDGDAFCVYRTISGHQPVIWPIFGPGGQAMTRQYPLGPKLPSEKDDHPHHRSLWFNHGSVNGRDFWMEPPEDASPEKDNQIIHREFRELASGDLGRIVSVNDWTSGGEKIAEDVRTIECWADEHGRWIDFAVEISASEGDVVFGDTKEGSFGVRVPGTMDVDAKQGGRIRNSRGYADEAAWGRAAEWVDYHGPVEGRPAGIVIFDLPDSFRHPTKWHVRTYGLFAANPFGQEDFPKTDDPEQGEAKIAKGEKLRLHYRVLFYSGEKSANQLQAIYKQYGGE
ncbi:MAG TPA: PmoA family protein [Lacipirellula sp.]